MKLVSWNVNGLRACMGKGFPEYLAAEDPDILCLQETKLQPEQAPDFPGRQSYWYSAEKKGYSGTAVLSKVPPLSVEYGLPGGFLSNEGRVITCRFPGFALVCLYAPNSQHELARLDTRLAWEADFLEYLVALDRETPVILCGDLNVAHAAIDLKNPDTNHLSAGFSDGERQALSRLLDAGFADTFRTLYPDTVTYSWWSYMFHAREKNTGWRIDYFLVSRRLLPLVRDSLIQTEVTGSDHCPIQLLWDEPDGGNRQPV